MRRREFMVGLGAAAWPLVARAQQSAVPVIGYLGNFGLSTIDEAVLTGLAETGYVEGRNVTIEYRWVAGQNGPALLRDLIERRVAVLVTQGTAMALAAKAATQTIPIVFRMGDPVATGLVPSLSVPGGNITGTTTLGVELGPKRLQMLRELLPAGATVALVANPRNANALAETREIQTAATVLGVRLLS